VATVNEDTDFKKGLIEADMDPEQVIWTVIWTGKTG
jgi:hypothetical protein